MKAHDFQSLYNVWLLDIKSLEEQLVDALPKMMEKATNTQLKQAIADHLDQTRGHLDRADRLITNLGGIQKGPKCAAMEGLIKEARDVMGEVDRGPLLDAALIGVAQKVEHYEISTYGTACTFAKMLGRDKDVEVLKKTLTEEYGSDDRLTGIATQTVNTQAREMAHA